MLLGQVSVRRRMPLRGRSSRPTGLRLHSRVAALLPRSIHSHSRIEASFLRRTRRAVNSSLKTEVGVLGAGPAGSAISRRLAQLGHSVVVVEKSVFPRSHVGESIAGSILPLLDVLGLRPRVEDFGFLRPAGSMVRWAGDHDDDRPVYGEPGFQVDRGRFDKLLLDAAAECGATLLQPVQTLNIDQCEGLWSIDVCRSEKPLRVEA